MKDPFLALLAITPILGGVIAGTPHASAQERVTIGDVIVGSILNDMAQDRQAERDAKRWPYMSHERGSIASAAEAERICAREIVAEAGTGSSIAGAPSTRTMATGWEVEGQINIANDQARPFSCSVRNGLISATLIQR